MSMKLRKNLGRLATAFVATAMLASLSAVPASAADAENTVPTTPVKQPQIQEPSEDTETLASISIEKELTKPENVYSPNVSFEFEVKPSTAESNLEGKLIEGEKAMGIMDNTLVEMEVYHGVTGGITTDNTYTGKVDFTPASSDIGKTVLTETAGFKVNPSAFPHAGVYKYVVTEKQQPEGNNNYEGVNNDTTTRVLYIYVAENSDAQEDESPMNVIGAVLASENGTRKDKTDRFTNTYLKNPDETDMSNELFVSKTVSGDMGNKEKQFAFTITIEGATGEKYYAVYETKNAEGNWVTDTSKDGQTVTNGAFTINTNSSTTFTLAHDERLHIYGLSDTDKYTIIETDAEQDEYTTSVTGYVNNDDTYSETFVIDKENTGYDKVVGTVNPEAEQIKTIAYTNTRNAVSPTGIVMNVAPYALLVVVAAGACFVFLRKRRED